MPSSTSSEPAGIPGEVRTFKAGIVLVGQPFCLSIGVLADRPQYIGVIPLGSDKPALWNFHVLGENYETIKAYVSTPDERYWWLADRGGESQPFRHCVMLRAEPPSDGNTILIQKRNMTFLLETYYGPGGYMEPSQQDGRHYLATNAAKSLQIAFVTD